MMNFTPIGAEAVRREARARGIDPSRIIISDFFPTDIEFAAKGLCDLFLDTRLFNGHTTVGDALWAGVPVLTLPGKVP